MYASYTGVGTVSGAGREWSGMVYVESRATGSATTEWGGRLLSDGFDPDWGDAPVHLVFSGRRGAIVVDALGTFIGVGTCPMPV